MLVGAPAAHRKLDRVRLAENDHAGCDQLAGQRGGGRRTPVAPRHRAAGRDPPFEVDQILQRDRDAVQRADRMARADRFVGGLGGKSGIVAIDIDVGVQFAVEPRDAREKRLDNIDRRQTPRCDLGGELVSRLIGRIGVGRAHRDHFGKRRR